MSISTRALPFNPQKARQLSSPLGNRIIDTIVSCVPNVAYPPDKAVIRAIQREFDPIFAWCWVTHVYKTPAGTIFTRGYHAAAAANPFAENEYQQSPWVYRALMPCGEKVPKPTKILLHLFERDPRTRMYKPGTFVPFDWRVYWVLRELRNEMTREERRLFLEEHGEHVVNRKAREAVERQDEDQEKADRPWLRRQVAKFSVDDWKRIDSRGIAYDPNPATRASVMVGKHAKKKENVA